MSQRILRQILGPSYDVTMAASPKEAIALLKSQTFSLLLSDFMFPRDDAIPLIQFARTLGNSKDLPIVVISSAMDSALLTKVLNAGANDGLGKPLRAEQIRGMVERMLTDPYVRTIEKRVTEVTCLQWENRGMHFQFCPELGVTVSGSSRPEAHERMAAHLLEQLNHGAGLGLIHSEKLVTHLLREGAPVAPSPTI